MHRGNKKERNGMWIVREGNKTVSISDFLHGFDHGVSI